MDSSEGEARYPYEMDGLNLWAYSNGYINACEGNLTIFRIAAIQEETSVDFWCSVKEGGCLIPVSITGSTKHMFEPESVSRYTVYSKRAAYYILETKECIFSLRANVTSQKEICFTLSAINTTESKREALMTSYIDPILRFANNEDGWALFRRYGQYDGKNTFKILRKPNPESKKAQDLTNIAIICRGVDCQNTCEIESTVAKTVFLGGKGRCLFNAMALRNRNFSKKIYAVNTIDLPVAAEIIKMSLNSGEEAQISYLVSIAHDDFEAERLINKQVDFAWINRDLEEQEITEVEKLSKLSIEFGEMPDLSVNYQVWNRFLKNVQKQISFCAFGKNYAGDLLGVRDVFQQLTAALMFNAADARKKIIMALNFIMENGRAPRQFSVPPREDIIPEFDIRQFIDQGLWIIETLHQYLSWTGDSSVLNEMCSYYRIIDEKKEQYSKSERADTVLEHLLKIVDYLISNIDDRTNCLKILYGDWNDAVSGLGESSDGEGFGSGVSVMATLQLYKALKDMSEILEMVGGHEKKRNEYAELREYIADGLEKYAIQTEGDKTHILHGWGDNGSYLVGSLCDSDGNKRYSVNAYSFWCISEMIQRNPLMKKDILKAYNILDSKYGIKTFEPYFPADMKGVGRIVDLTPGTYENSCAYIHATMFAVMALFKIGEPERAWEQIKKAVPVSHNSVSKTPFVMPNSYCYNKEYCIDGESAGDWYTGSGAVLMRCIIEHALGIQAVPCGLRIETPHYLPSDFVKMTIQIKGSVIDFSYRNMRAGKRTYLVNGVKQDVRLNNVSGEKFIYLDNSTLAKRLDLEVID